MFVRHGILLGVTFLACVFVIACGPPANPPAPSAPKWTVENPGAASGSSRGAGQSKTRQTSAPSSLDALRSGQSTATPASSPLQDVFFAFDRYELQDRARETLKANAGWLKSNAAARVQIEGHCDERGSNEYNMALGAKRAQAAMDYLVTLGVPKDRLAVISYGEEVPSCTEAAEACWEKNRRARFVIVSGGPTS